MSALFAFLHHLAAFALVSALAVELVLVRSEMTATNARRLLTIDAIYGAAAGTIIIVGFLRVFFFEKGASYYFHSIPFIIKISLFAMVGLLSIYPTRHFLSWRRPLRQGAVPAFDAGKLQAIRRVIHWELIALVGVILCAALMARGIGYVGAA